MVLSYAEDRPLNQDEVSLPVRVAVIGCGHWGQNVVRALAELGALEAIVDTDAQTVNRMVKRFGARPRSLESALADPAVTAIAIAAPAKMHYPLAMQALAAGKHVFVEKPIALDTADAQALICAARDRARILMVGHILQYHQGYRAVRNIVRSGRLGRLQYICSHRLSLGKVRREEDVLWSFAPHDLSMILDLAAEEPEEVTTTGAAILHPSIRDVCHVDLRFPSGLKAHVFVSWLHPFKEQRLSVIGEHGAVVFDDVAPLERKVTLFPYAVSHSGPAPVPGTNGCEAVSLPGGEPLTLEMLHFLDCCRTGANPDTDAANGMRVVAVLKRASASRASPGGTQSPGEVPQSRFVDAYVDRTAVIDADVEIGQGTKVWHFTHILDQTRIGRDVVVGQNVMIGPRVSIGDQVKIQNNVSIYEGVTLEEGVFCGPSCVFTNVLEPRAQIERKTEFRKTIVRRGATIGANATIICGHLIGRYAFVAAGAVVTRDVPDFALVAGVPAKQIGWVSRSGRRLGPELVCPDTGARYRLTPQGALEEVM
jgi:UDP-2-acetamido-3-amino-2,3-dideoxy-glucuronate N-acetyltransferase